VREKNPCALVVLLASIIGPEIEKNGALIKAAGMSVE
jgi:hypothetical protein